MTSTLKPKVRPAAPRAGDDRLTRFAQALRQAMVVNQISERKMASLLGITSGTTQKYFRGEVDPLKVGTAVNRGLAKLLGVTTDQLCDFYETGDYSKEVVTDVSFEDVVAWMQSEAGAEHICEVLETAAHVCRLGPHGGLGVPRGGPKLGAFTWPLEELKSAGVSAALQERMGLTEEALDGLVNEGRFDEALVEAFSVATNLDPVEVRKAFKKRVPIPSEQS
jgi:transcriptional regulator with XRE-family HTH domain